MCMQAHAMLHNVRARSRLPWKTLTPAEPSCTDPAGCAHACRGEGSRLLNPVPRLARPHRAQALTGSEGATDALLLEASPGSVALYQDASGRPMPGSPMVGLGVADRLHAACFGPTLHLQSASLLLPLLLPLLLQDAERLPSPAVTLAPAAAAGGQAPGLRAEAPPVDGAALHVGRAGQGGRGGQGLLPGPAPAVCAFEAQGESCAGHPSPNNIRASAPQ